MKYFGIELLASPVSFHKWAYPFGYTGKVLQQSKGGTENEIR